MTQSREKSIKPHFGPFFGPNFPQKFFFSKIGLHHYLSSMNLQPRAKNQKKLMIQSGEKLRTNELTN